MTTFDAVIVGAGPNGLAAAAHLAKHDRKVLVVEQAGKIGGGTRTEELTLPGYLHDVCSAIHPLAIASPFFDSMDLDFQWVQPEIPASHPLGRGRGAAAMRDLDATIDHFGDDDDRYQKMIGPLVSHSDDVIEDFLRPLFGLPKNPASFARMATRGALPASRIIDTFASPEARAVLSGMAAHAVAPFSSTLTGGVMMLFAMTTHAYGWPMVEGGSQRLAEALSAVIVTSGGEIQTSQMVTALDDLPEATVYMLDVMPDATERIAGSRLDDWSRRRLRKHRRGPGIFKLDWALDGPIPWLDEFSPRAGTVHVGGTFEDVASAEDAVHAGKHPERPFVLLAQQSIFDPSRAPDGKHTAWAYCHVPNGSDVDMTGPIEAQIERFAPGFRDLILDRSAMGPAAMESHNPNYLGGDMAGGGFGMRKVLGGKLGNPYRVGDGIYMCSSATPPGAGVHGMCGFNAAESALKRELS